MSPFEFMEENNFELKEDSLEHEEEQLRHDIVYPSEALDNYKKSYSASNKKQKILGILLLIWLVACLVVAFIGYNLNMYLGLGALGAFALTIVICVIGVIILQKRGLSKKWRKRIDELTLATATVKTCFIKSQTSTSDRYRPYTTHVTLSVVYMVILDVDGHEVRAYSRKFYEDGEKIPVYLEKRNSRICHIDE